MQRIPGMKNPRAGGFPLWLFEFCFDNGLLGRHLINCEIVGGATATGLANPRSTSGARARFEGAVLRYRRFDTIFLMLGEVDCSVTFWLLAARSAQAATDFIPRALQNIAGMVEWIRKQVPGKAIFLVAAPLPSVTDEQSGQQELPLRQRIGPAWHNAPHWFTPITGRCMP